MDFIHTRKLFSAGVALVALATIAQAADMPPLSIEDRTPVYNDTGSNGFSWTGLYLGGHAGYGWSAVNQDITNFLGILGLGGFDMNGGFGGGQLGFNYQTGMFVFGVEADGSHGNVNQSVTRFGITGKSEIDYFGTVRARAGVG